MSFNKSIVCKTMSEIKNYNDLKLRVCIFIKTMMKRIKNIFKFFRILKIFLYKTSFLSKNKRK